MSGHFLLIENVISPKIKVGVYMHKNQKLKTALSTTINRLSKKETPYQWGHFGQCNCGHLAQSVTQFTSREIHQSASLLGGDWGVRAEEFCPVSRHLIDDIIRQLLVIGLEQEDIIHLENLSDPQILKKIPGQPKELERHSKEDAIKYLQAMYDFIDE